MAWERRKNGKRYFYWGRKINGRVVKEYFGSGPLAELAAQRLESRKLERQQRREQLQKLKADAAAQDEIMNSGSQSPQKPQKPGSSSPNRPSLCPDIATLPPETVRRFAELLAAHQAGDTSADDELIRLTVQHPALSNGMGDLGVQVIENYMNTFTEDPVFRAAIRTKLAELQRQFAVAANDPVGKLIVDRILATSVQVAYADVRRAQVESTDLKVLEFLARRQQQAQQQHLAALSAWRQWRRLEADLPQTTPAPIEPEISEPADESGDEPWIPPFPRKSDALNEELYGGAESSFTSSAA